MRIENPLAFGYLLQDDLYLLDKERAAFNSPLTVPAASTPAMETPGITFKYLGGNKKHILILVNYPDTEFMAPAHLAALESTLKRLGTELTDVALVNMAGNTAGVKDLAGYFEPAKILIHGKNALPGGLAPQLNNIAVVDGRRVLYTYGFGEMIDNTAFKKIFWEQIKQW